MKTQRVKHWKGSLGWYMQKYKVRKIKNVGGSKDSTGNDLIAECLSTYQSEEELMREKEEMDKMIEETTKVYS